MEQTKDGEASDLDERKAAILKAVVEEYVETAQPVGSQAIAGSTGLGVSSATVRNELTLLERDGYLVQPHTSAGRVPTDRGYRYFVDHFTSQGALPAGQRRAVAEFFATTHQALEDLLHETSQLLARVTRHAALVMGPETQLARVRSVQVVPLQPGVALLVVVLSNGMVEKEVVSLAGLGTEPAAEFDDLDDARLHAATAALTAQIVGHERAQLPAFAATGDPTTDAIARLIHGLMTRPSESPGPEPLYVGGAGNLVAEPEAFATAKSAARLLEMLEHQVVVVSLVRELLDRGLSVSIGTENPLDELRDCAIVLAPFEIDGHAAGIVGVMGPTRMDYRHALAAVSAVSAQLGRHLS